MDDARGRSLSWGPILDPDEIARAWELLNRFGHRLRDPHVAESEAVFAALVLGYAGIASESQAFADAAVSIIEHSSEQLAATPGFGPGFVQKAVPLAWVLEHFRNGFSWDSDGDPNELLHTVLEDQVNDSASSFPLGLVGGISGLALYFLERPFTPEVASILERILLHLAESQSSRMGLGRSWWTHPLFMPADLRAGRPHGHYDLSVATGVPGILGVVGQVAGAGVGHSLAVGMWRRGVRWLLSKRLDEPGFPLPEFWGTNVPSAAGVESWRQGSIAAGAVLHGAAMAMDDAGCAGESYAWLRAASARRAEAREPANATLLDGTAGLGHIYNRLYHRTGDALFGDRARFWLRRTLESFGRETAAWSDGDAVPAGLAGTGLALLAAIVDQEPMWDRLLLLSPPSSVHATLAGAPASHVGE